jgi:hypothetical protein
MMAYWIGALSMFVVCIVFISSSKSREVQMWVIEGGDLMSRAWIRRMPYNLRAPFSVTFTILEAQTFLSEEDAKHEMLRLGLNGAWSAVPKGGK